MPEELPERRTVCAIVGGGPAGLVLGLLLARAGLDVTVLEKHADFLRDFRGDTVHPTTLALLDDLGLFDRFEKLRHSKITDITLPGQDGQELRLADFSHLPVRHRYIAMVPQWDLLNLLADAARAEPGFTLLTEHEVTGVLTECSVVRGVRYRSPDGEGALLADLTVACDGRWSVVRRSLGLRARQIPVGFDVWWYRLPTRQNVGESLLPRLTEGRVAIGIPREGYLQVAQIGRKGSDADLRARGIEAFRQQAAQVFPELAGDVNSIASLQDVKHLDVRVQRLRRWHVPGALCLGDAAHAMSPVGGVGINLAVQDAVAAARILAAPLRQGALRDGAGERYLARVQRRRMVPAVAIQGLQRLMHRVLIMPALDGRIARPPRWLSTVLRRAPWLATVPALVIGIGPRPERAPRWARHPGSGR